MMAIDNRFMKVWLRKEERENRRISLTEISEQTGVGWGTLNRWKNDQVDRFDASILTRFCAYFDCQVGDLLVYVPDAAADAEPEKARS